MLVSSAMAVVITRVTPSMLPPTTITAPTSEAARPKPAITTVRSEKRVSHRTVGTARSRETPSEVSCSRYSFQASSVVWRARAATMGTTSTVCATTMAAGVKRMPKEPRGPARDSRR